MGDSIYDYSQGVPIIRLSVHNKDDNQDHDIDGKFVLLSNHFYYFGDNAIEIPESLWSIVKQGQAHKSNANEPYKLDFVDWLDKTPHDPNVLHGKPQYKLNFKRNRLQNCAPKC